MAALLEITAQAFHQRSCQSSGKGAICMLALHGCPIWQQLRFQTQLSHVPPLAACESCLVYHVYWLPYDACLPSGMHSAETASQQQEMGSATVVAVQVWWGTAWCCLHAVPK